VKLKRTTSLASIALVSALALAACGSNSNGSGGSSSGASGNCGKGVLNASGSSAQANAMSEWVKAYRAQCAGVTINYNPAGSGQGVTDFTGGQTAFAGSDSALSPTKGEPAAADKRCSTGKAVDLPMVPGPIAVVYNLSGVTNLTLTPSVIAKIYSGKVTKWNDPAIASINSGVTLPSATITTVHRSDSSGTTDNFTKYLTAAAGSDWTFDHDKVWKAPGGLGGAQSVGVAGAVKNTPNTIGYVEYSFATQNQLGIAKIDNGAGAVELTPANVSKAVAAATVTGTGDDLTLSLDYATKVADAYPIILVTYEITCLKGLPADQATMVKGFLTYAASDAGQAKLTDLGYAPLPKVIQTRVQAVIAKIA
jgi:phosphate transport system substrate-binding protein